ncbi:MAG TPA: hypothetical protein PLD92_07100 [Candidatus Omnitrophota bacterium]|mgnify:CR=1 FL=1|nr:hypothetical protein [Candidatus Omnitrophota bacterium]
MNNETPQKPFNIPQVLPLLKQENIVAIYVVLLVLKKMRMELGLEPMHEYMDAYINIIERHNHRLKRVVAQLLTVLNVDKIYRDCIDHENS